MRKFNSLVLALCMISCTANKNDVNVVDWSISETESSTTKKDKISPMKTKFVWKNSLGEDNDVVEQDTLGKPIVINDKICEQISAIAAQDKKLSYSDSIIQIVNVRWRVNLMSGGIVLMTSVQPEDPKMKQVVKYLNSIYGKPYLYDEDEYNIKWSSSDNPLDRFRPDCTLVHLRRIHSEEGGTCLIF